VEEGLEVSLETCGEGVRYLYVPLIDQDGLGGEALMLYIVLLESAETHDGACQNRPQFLVFEGFALKGPFVDFF
jgi:hypothetical protein